LCGATPEGRLSFINRPLAEFLGVDSQVPTSHWADRLHPEDRGRVLAKFDRCSRDQSEYRDEFRIRRFDGEYRQVIAEGLPRHSPTGDFDGYAGVLRDITERREAEHQVQESTRALAAELRERTRSEEQIHSLTVRLMNAQEEERARLARELHDDFSQQIAAVSIAIANLKKRLPPELADAPEPIRQKLVALAESARRLSHELHPSVLQYSGLPAALRRYCSELEGLTSHRIAFVHEGSCEGLPPAAALCAYRVAQEALQNTIKHSRVSAAEVLLRVRRGVLTLVVSDHGIGMASGASGGLGLVSMRERSRLVGGDVAVESRAGEGVRVTLTIPFGTAARQPAEPGIESAEVPLSS
jgi:PAS domain S-box-containing protein